MTAIAVTISPILNTPTFQDNLGNPLAGGKIYAYVAGSTTTLQTTYADSSGGTANSNPIVLDSSGRLNTSIWLVNGSFYKFVVTTASGTVLSSFDNIVGTSPGVTASIVVVETVTATQGQTVVPLANQYTIGANALQVSLNGAVQVVGIDYTETSAGSITMATGLNADDVICAKIFSTSLYTAPVATTIVYNEGDAGAINRYVTNRLQDIVTVKDFGAVGNGTDDDTDAIQYAIDACSTSTGGIVYFPPGTYYTDTLVLASRVTLNLTGAKLLFKGHSTSHNPVIRMGTVAAAITNAHIIGGEIDGNSVAQTYPSDEWSPCVFIMGSSYCSINGTKMHNMRGDGVTIGYDSGRVEGANFNTVENCEVYDIMAPRQAIAVTYGNSNRILNNKCTGQIDLELNVSTGECKHNLVSGNCGRVVTDSVGAPHTSDLSISLASLNTDSLRYYGNIVTNNHCNAITLQYNKKSTITNNVIVGSNSAQTWLVDIAGCDQTLFSNNQLQANKTVATALAYILRTRGCDTLQVTNNQISGDTISPAFPFHTYSAGYPPSVAANHIFRNNQTDTGFYRAAGALPSETATFRVDQVNAGTLTMTQVAGVKCYGAVSRAGSSFILSSIGNAGASYVATLRRECNATAAGATSVTHNCEYSQTTSGSNRTFTVFTNAPAAGAVTLTAFSFAAAGGTGTFFVDVIF